MARISDEVIKAIYDLLRQPFSIGDVELEDKYHPDPVGFLSRAEVLSGFDQSFVGEKGEIGVCAVPKKRLDSQGRDGKDIDENVRAAIETDIRHYYIVDDGGLQDIDMMHAAWLVGPSRAKKGTKESDKLLSSIKSNREKVRMICEPSDNGQDATDLIDGISGDSIIVSGQQKVDASGLDQFATPEGKIVITEEGKAYQQVTEKEKMIASIMRYLERQ